MARRRLALVLLNPGRTRRIRFGKRRVYTIRLDPKTQKVIGRATRSARVPAYWVGLPWRNIRALERELRALAKGTRECALWSKCYEETRDRRGRRRPCRQTIRTVGDFVAALEAALDGALDPAYPYLDDDSPTFMDLRDYGVRRLRNWRDALRLAMPRSRRWEDVDPLNLRRLSEYFEQELDRNAYGVPLRLELPAETARIFESRRRRQDCDDVAGEATARALERALKQALELRPVPLDDVPF